MLKCKSRVTNLPVELIAYIDEQPDVGNDAENVGVPVTSLCETWNTNVPTAWFSRTVALSSRFVITGAIFCPVI